MEYYCLACQVGSETRNMRLIRKICKNNFPEKKEFDIYNPVREIREKTPFGYNTVMQPLLYGYLIIATDYDLTSIAHLIRRMSLTSYGLARNMDHSYILRGSDKAYAAWVCSFKGVIKESKIKVRKTLAEGTQVTVISGPMKDLQGRIVRLNKKTKCLVEIPFLGEIRRINLPIEIVEEIDERGEGAPFGP